ncbi:hypothetical protein K9M42_03405 [Patescibacteria group bacterium]|nr:hypothetical protein [Patescibacteria group bacterium]
MKNIEIKKRHAEKMNSKEIKQKISKACSGQKNGFYGKTHTKEAINKIIEKNKKYRENLTEDEKQKISNKLKEAQIRIKNKNPDEYRKNKIKAAIVSSKSQYRYKINNIEKKVMDYLIAKGVDVKYSIIMGCYQYDFKVKEEKILIECNGIYWHGHPDYYNINGSNGKRKLNDIQIKKQQKDKDKKEFAVHRGFEIITI